MNSDPFTKYTDEEQLAGALAAANEVRAVLGHEPIDRIPPGLPNAWCLCPIAKAIDPDGNVSVVNFGGVGIRATRDGELIAEVRNEAAYVFVARFDMCLFPDLILPNPFLPPIKNADPGDENDHPEASA